MIPRVEGQREKGSNREKNEQEKGIEVIAKMENDRTDVRKRGERGKEPDPVLSHSPSRLIYYTH